VDAGLVTVDFRDNERIVLATEEGRAFLRGHNA
jgi:hypothetical protein